MFPEGVIIRCQDSLLPKFVNKTAEADFGKYDLNKVMSFIHQLIALRAMNLESTNLYKNP